MEIAVTIGICIRNCENSVIDTLKSVINQDFPKDKMEIVIVDDGSTDKTLEIVKAFASRADVITRVYSQNWKGIASARNVVVKESRGRYIIWVDGDMKLPKDHVRKQVEFMKHNSKVGAAKARYGFLRTKKLVTSLENSRAFDLQPNASKLWGTGGSIYRVNALREIGGFDEHNKGAGEDIDALVRIQEKGWLLCTTSTEFYEEFKETWRDLWRQYCWWGYGAHFVHHRHTNSISIGVRLPPIAFLTGILRLSKIFKQHPKTIYLFLPFHSIFKETAWCVGFVKSHFDQYGHRSQTIKG